MRLRDYRPIIECVGRPGRFPGRPLEGATVSLARTRVSAPTDARGRYLLAGVPPGAHTVTVAIPGYGTRSQEVEVTYYDARVLNGLYPRDATEPVDHTRLENSIEIMNRGLEAAVTAWLIDAPAFRWNMNVAYEWNRNRITDFGPQAVDDSMPGYRQKDDGRWEQVSWVYTRKLESRASGTRAPQLRDRYG